MLFPSPFRVCETLLAIYWSLLIISVYLAKVRGGERPDMSNADNYQGVSVNWVYDTLLTEYFSLGATGESAIETMVDDLDNDRLRTTAKDWNITLSVCIDVINALSFDIKYALLGEQMCDGLNQKRLHDAVRYQRSLRENMMVGDGDADGIKQDGSSAN